jgi:Holliday junction DNA helicase RuvA
VIGSLRGEVLERWNDGTVLIDVGGIGYEVTVSPRAFGELEPTTSAFLYIHHHIREDDQTLYGFLARDERTTFKTLIAAHGVGPALALAILATYPPAALADVVANGDVAALKAVPGVGPKTAQRLLVELRDRLALPLLDSDLSAAGIDGGSAPSTVGAVREALAGLGYGADEIRDAVRQLPGEGDAATLLRDALKLLGARRA